MNHPSPSPTRDQDGQVLVDELVRYVRQIGLSYLDLDMVVHDVADAAVGSGPPTPHWEDTEECWSHHASNVNNRGLDGQVEFLVDRLGPTRALTVINDLATS